MTMKQRNQRGFTLIEIMVVVVILGISFFVYRTYVLGQSTAGILGGPGVGKNPYTLIVKSGDV